jgi:hypothetical protein
LMRPPSVLRNTNASGDASTKRSTCTMSMRARCSGIGTRRRALAPRPFSGRRGTRLRAGTVRRGRIPAAQRARRLLKMVRVDIDVTATDVDRFARPHAALAHRSTNGSNLASTLAASGCEGGEEWDPVDGTRNTAHNFGGFARS